MTGPEKTFHNISILCEVSDSFVIKKASRSRVKTKICVSRSKSRDSSLKMAPFKVEILLEIRLGEVSEPKILTFS